MKFPQLSFHGNSYYLATYIYDAGRREEEKKKKTFYGTNLKFWLIKVKCKYVELEIVMFEKGTCMEFINVSLMGNRKCETDGNRYSRSYRFWL